jgi:hypothetical protein
VKLSELQYNQINTDDEIISAIGTHGKIVDQHLKKAGHYFELYLSIKWNNGNTSYVLFPDECENITLTKEPYIHQPK